MLTIKHLSKTFGVKKWSGHGHGGRCGCYAPDKGELHFDRIFMNYILKYPYLFDQTYSKEAIYNINLYIMIDTDFIHR